MRGVAAALHPSNQNSSDEKGDFHLVYASNKDAY